jgi:hypothetical protein
VLTLDFKGDDVFGERVGDLTRLQYLQDRALSLATRLHSSLATVRKLGETSRELHARGNFSGSDTDFQRIRDETANFESELEGHIQDAKLLQKRARETLALVSEIYLVSLSNNTTLTPHQIFTVAHHSSLASPSISKTKR